MISGVLTVEFRLTRAAPPSRTIRVLVRNAENLQDAIVKGVSAAIELCPEVASITHAVAANWGTVELDAVA